MSAPVRVRVLVLLVAAIGFLFDTYELLMFPVIGADAVSELLNLPADSVPVRLWIGRMLWIAALCGGAFGLLGGMLIDRFGRKTVMVASILLYSVSPVLAAFSTELWMLVLFRCTTFIGVCVEMVAAVTWLAELFETKRARELAIGWSLAAASVGGILVTEVYSELVHHVRTHNEPLLNIPFPTSADSKNLAWRYTLLTGLVPGVLILLLMPFVPESRVWAEKKKAGTLQRPRFRELFAPEFLRTTLVTAGLSACAYAAAFGALQLTPAQMMPGLPKLAPQFKEARAAIGKAEKAVSDADAALIAATEAITNASVPATAPGAPPVTLSPQAQAAMNARAAAEAAKEKAIRELNDARKAFVPVQQDVKLASGNIQRWQELGGLTGRILLAIFLIFIPSRTLLRLFLIPGIVLFPVTYLYLYQQPYVMFATAIFFCGLLTVAQFSYLSEFLPKVFPLHLRGTGGSFATNIGGRMLGTMAAVLNTEFLSTLFKGDSNAIKVATAAACIGGGVYLIAFLLTFFLPVPKEIETATSSG